MPQFIPLVPKPNHGEPSWPTVRVVLRSSQGQEIRGDFRKGSILLGSHSECDLPIPDASMPPILAILTPFRHQLYFRSLSQTITILRDGQPFVEGWLSTDDRLTIQGLTLQAHIYSGRLSPSRRQDDSDSANDPASAMDILAHERAMLVSERQKLAEERRDWEQDAERQAESLALRSRQLLAKESALTCQLEELEKRSLGMDERASALCERERHLTEREQEIANQLAQLEDWRAELQQLRSALHDQYRKRKDKLSLQRAALEQAVRKLREEKHGWEQIRDHWSREKQEWETTRHEWQERQNSLERQHQIIMDWQKDLEQEHEHWLQQTQARELQLHQAEKALADKQREHQADLVRLERFHATLLERQRSLEKAEKGLHLRRDDLLKQAEELTARAEECTQWSERLRCEEEQLKANQAEVQERHHWLQERSTELELQQRQVTLLWGRAEKMEAEIRQREHHLAQERLRVEKAEHDLQETAKQLHQDRLQWQADRQAWEAERLAQEKRQADLVAELDHIRDKEKALVQAQQQLNDQQARLEAFTMELAQTSQLLRHRGIRLQKIRQRLVRQNRQLHEQADLLTQTDQAREMLQEQLRWRSAQLAEREQALLAAEQRWQKQAEQWQLQQADAQAQHQKDVEERNRQQAALAEQLAALESQRATLAAREQTLEDQSAWLQEEQSRLEGWAARLQRQAAAMDEQSQSWLQARDEWQQQLPSLLEQARSAVQQLGLARQQLRTHLQEVHAFIERSQKELTQWQNDLADRGQTLQSTQNHLLQLRTENRLEISQFKLFLSEWQEHLQQFRHGITQDQTSLQEREAQLALEASRLQQSHSELELRSEKIKALEEAIQARRTSLNRHLHDLQSWYRLKIKELAEKHLGRTATANVSSEPTILRLPLGNGSNDDAFIERLVQLDLIDDKTLRELHAEAHAKSKTLKQLMLEAELLTPYQIRMLEEDRLECLAFGTLRIVDQLRILPQETIYRVFDGKRGGEAILRHLHPQAEPWKVDDFRNQFSQAMVVRHPQVAETLDVVEFEGRPAAEQEWVIGLPSTEWSKLAVSVSIWLHLFRQAVSGLRAIHDQGLVHGHLHAGRVLLAGHGELKICGLGEPLWLVQNNRTTAPTQEDDLRALGKLLRHWKTPKQGTPGWKPSLAPLDVCIQGLTSATLQAPFHSVHSLEEYLLSIQTSSPLDEACWQSFLDRVNDLLAPQDPHEPSEARRIA